MDTRPVKIYSSESVPRLRYIADIILGDILGLSWELITDKRKLGKCAVINYSDEIISGSFKISPDSLLFETGVAPRVIAVKEWKSLPVFFMTTSDSDIPFDIFAASFYLISRYEEYLEFQPDEYGRFPASSSLAFKNEFLGIPIVDKWVKEMSKAFVKKYQTLTFKRNEYKALLTVDIDEPFAYQGKNIFRSISTLFSDLKSNSTDIGDRVRILAGGERDPYNVCDYIFEKIEKSKTSSCFFLTVGDHSKYDKNPSWKSEDYRKMICDISNSYNTGLHPSFYAADNSVVLSREMVRLRTILNKEIVKSRFHYIRISMPESYRDILKNGVTEEYSMGYPEEPGFRAGLARPFYFYDVREDMQTKLKIIPFQVMDATLKKYKKLNPDDSKEIILKLISETRNVGGHFVSIWHNTSLLENEECQSWREVFEFMLNNQKT
jgi:hypothetical protein